jgi:hypothetical protein
VTAIERLTAAVMLVLLVAVGSVLWVRHYGAEQYQAGHDAAIAAGKEQYDRDAAAARKTESDLRAQLRAKDADALRQKEEHEKNLANAQRRMRAGADSLRCPAVGPVPDHAAPDDRPAAGGPDPDTAGPRIVPETAADLLGVAADIAGIVRKYDRLEQRFEACRALNAEWAAAWTSM